MPAKKRVAKAVAAPPAAVPKTDLPFYVITGRLYEWFKTFALVLVPGVGALYLGLAQIWGWPDADKVTGSCTVVGIFLGLFLKNSSNTYKNRDGDVDAYVPPGTFEGPLAKQDKVVFKVDHNLSA